MPLSPSPPGSPTGPISSSSSPSHSPICHFTSTAAPSLAPHRGGFYTYGFLNAEQRAHIDSIANLTPPNAVIAASLNSGSISLYANRDTIRPGHLLQPGRTWTDEELITFVNALRAESRPLYLLMDSEEMTGPADALRKCCRLAPIAELYLPYYYHNGAAANKIITLYRVDYP